MKYIYPIIVVQETETCEAVRASTAATRQPHMQPNPPNNYTIALTLRRLTVS